MDKEADVVITDGGTHYVGSKGVNLYRLAALRSALKLWAEHKMKVNRAYTPTRMLKAAGEATGIKYKRGEQALAAADITDLIKKLRGDLSVSDERSEG